MKFPMIACGSNFFSKLTRIGSNVDNQVDSVMVNGINDFDKLAALLSQAVIENPPVTIRDGGVIAEGFNQQLDELRALSNNADNFLIDLEEKEKQTSGLNTLKVGFNKVHGFYIEVSRAQSEQVPEHFVRRQTLKNVERFITPELKQYEEKVLSAKSKSLALEKEIYQQLIQDLQPFVRSLHASAKSISELDVLLCFADVAISYNYVCPELIDEKQII